jgi:glyoxylase-like metal-dependent hydrolase (beta-lactamase superfamily II)
MTLPQHQLFALRYAHRPALRHENFIGGDPHDAPMPLDYFVWVVITPEGEPILIDTGFTAEVAAQRKRQWFRCPVESLALLGVDPAAVKHCILTHLHYDHVGTFHKLPNARFHLQEAEIHFATGRYMKYQQLRHSYEVEDVVGIVRANYQGRVNFYAGDAELCPGITLHSAPGHSAGLQFVRVHTARGWVVVASDVTHFYEHMETERPFVVALHIGQMMEGYERLRAAAPSLQHIVPGHDPLVMQRYRAPTPELEGIVVRLDEAPVE